MPQTSDQSPKPHCVASIRRGALALAVLAVALAPAAQAQRSRRPDALRGSRASVEKMHEFARSHRLTFYLTPTNVDAAVARGSLVALAGDANYELTGGVLYSYASREARAFVTQFAPQYLHACGMPLTVTSAARPMSRQPRNSSPHSVHPTGIAVDLRRPYAGPCLDWVRASLAQLEAMGIIEATEERHPVHFHIAVLVPPGRSVVLPSLTRGMVAAARVEPAPTAVTVTATAASTERPANRPRQKTYQVRQGDTLWEVARRNGVSVKSLARVNGRSTRALLRPGTVLMLPAVSGS